MPINDSDKCTDMQDPNNWEEISCKFCVVWTLMAAHFFIHICDSDLFFCVFLLSQILQFLTQNVPFNKHLHATYSIFGIINPKDHPPLNQHDMSLSNLAQDLINPHWKIQLNNILSYCNHTPILLLYCRIHSTLKSHTPSCQKNRYIFVDQCPVYNALQLLGLALIDFKRLNLLADLIRLLILWQ